MLLEKRLPGSLSFPLRRWLNSVPHQDLSDRAATDVVPQIGECALDSSIAPGAVLIRQAHDQPLNLLRSPRSSRASLFAAVVLLRDQTPVPRQQRLGRDDRAQLDQNLPSEPFRFGGQPATLAVGEAQSLLAQLFP